MPSDVSVHGWSLPLAFDTAGGFQRRRLAPIEDAIRLVVEIVPGERSFLPSFGCRVHELASIDSVEERQIAAALIEEALEHWAPSLRVRRVDVIEVRQTPDDTADSGSTATLVLDVWREQHRFTIELLWFGGRG